MKRRHSELVAKIEEDSGHLVAPICIPRMSDWSPATSATFLWTLSGFLLQTVFPEVAVVLQLCYTEKCVCGGVYTHMYTEH